MNYVPPHLLQDPPGPCRHHSYYRDPELPPGMARCNDIGCRQVFLYLDLTQACSDAPYARNTTAGRELHAKCSGFILTPNSPCYCPCHGARLVAPSRPMILTDPGAVDHASPTTVWRFGNGTVTWLNGQPRPVLCFDGHQSIPLTSVGEIDMLMAALAGARAQLTAPERAQ